MESTATDDVADDKLVVAAILRLTLRRDGRQVGTAIATSADINPTSKIKNIQVYNKENHLKAKQNNCI